MFYINKITSNRTVDYAAEEMGKYLRMMMPDFGAAEITYNPKAKDGFRLGLMQDFGLDVSDIEDTMWDDCVFIDTTETGGIIAGCNPRSVLLAVYEYFRRNGCRWLMTRVDGEYIPLQDVVPVKYRHKADSRYRMWGNEGSQSQQSMLDMIEFTPKIGLNGVYIQGRIPMIWCERYYNHEHNNENMPEEPISPEQVLQWTRQCEAEINKRGLMFMAGGHGYTTDPFGISTAKLVYTDEEEKYAVSEENRKYVAMLNGERKLNNGRPSFTNFCMSNPDARRMVVEYVADFIEKHSNIDVFSLPLADGYNNYCECENCRKMRPSDWLVTLLNDLDAELTKRGLDTKIEFAVYVDCIWAPLKARFKNPDRFIIGYAPISRKYLKTMTGIPGKVAPYVYNKNVLPEEEDDYYAHLVEWKAAADIPVHVTEYHFWAHYFFDPSSFAIAERAYEDNYIYKKLGMNGMMHFISMHNAFPNGYAYYLNARQLFDNSVKIEDIKEDYFSHAYGEHYKEIIAFFDEIKENFDQAYLESKKGLNGTAYFNPPESEKFKKGTELCEKGLALCDKIGNPPYRVQAESKKILRYYSRYIKWLGDILALKALGKGDEAYAEFDKMRLEFGKIECEIGEHYDHFMTMQSIWYIVNNMDEIIE